MGPAPRRRAGGHLRRLHRRRLVAGRPLLRRHAGARSGPAAVGRGPGDHAGGRPLSRAAATAGRSPSPLGRAAGRNRRQSCCPALRGATVGVAHRPVARRLGEHGHDRARCRRAVHRRMAHRTAVDLRSPTRRRPPGRLRPGAIGGRRGRAVPARRRGRRRVVRDPGLLRSGLDRGHGVRRRGRPLAHQRRRAHRSIARPRSGARQLADVDQRHCRSAGAEQRRAPLVEHVALGRSGAPSPARCPRDGLSTHRGRCTGDGQQRNGSVAEQRSLARPTNPRCAVWPVPTRRFASHVSPAEPRPLSAPALSPARRAAVPW